MYNMPLILLSGYSEILRISSAVGALSSAYLRVFGNPRLIFFHETGISDISQNNFIAFTKLRNVEPVISSLSTLSFWYCKNLTMQLNAQLGFYFPFDANRLHLSSIVPSGSKLI